MSFRFTQPAVCHQINFYNLPPNKSAFVLCHRINQFSIEHDLLGRRACPSPFRGSLRPLLLHDLRREGMLAPGANGSCGTPARKQNHGVVMRTISLHAVDADDKSDSSLDLLLDMVHGVGFVPAMALAGSVVEKVGGA